MEGNCQCGSPAVYEIIAHQPCGCQSTDIYCRTHASEQWYASGLFGRKCPKHRQPTQVTYHPRKLGTETGCILCPGECPVWRTR